MQSVQGLSRTSPVYIWSSRKVADGPSEGTDTDAEVAAVSSVNLNDYISRQKLDKNQIRVIHKSQPIPGAPLVFSSLLNKNVKKIIKNLVLNAHNEVEIGGYGGKMERYIDVLENKQKFLESYIQPQWGLYTYLSIISLIALLYFTFRE